MQVFICYSRVDKAFATHLYEALSDYDLDVWMDVHRIPSGANWDLEVQKGLDASTIMLVLLSPASVASENVTDEWSYFIDKNRKIIPLMIERCEVPFRLLRRQFIDFTLDYKLAFQQLIMALGSPALRDPDSTQRVRPVKAGNINKGPMTEAVPQPAAPVRAPVEVAARPEPGKLPRRSPTGPNVGIKTLPIIWADNYHWFSGLGRKATAGNIMISPREVKLVPPTRPIITIPISSIVSAHVMRSVDQYLQLTYYNSAGKFQSLVLMGAPKDRRQEINQELMNLLKLVTGRSLE